MVTLILFSISCVVLAICFILKLNLANIIPIVPYTCGFSISLCLIALGFLSFIGSTWVLLLLKYLLNFLKNYHHSVISNDKEPVLTCIAKEKKEKLSKMTTIVFCIFIILLVISFVICTFSAKEFAFWHKWQWFA